jgi:hypothetical protein
VFDAFSGQRISNMCIVYLAVDYRRNEPGR